MYIRRYDKLTDEAKRKFVLFLVENLKDPEKSNYEVWVTNTEDDVRNSLARDDDNNGVRIEVSPFDTRHGRVLDYTFYREDFSWHEEEISIEEAEEEIEFRAKLEQDRLTFANRKQ